MFPSENLTRQVPHFMADMHSGSAFEALSLDIGSFSIAPCVQDTAGAKLAVDISGKLHEMALALALKGPKPELMDTMRVGLPLQVGAQSGGASQR